MFYTKFIVFTTIIGPVILRGRHRFKLSFGVDLNSLYIHVCIYTSKFQVLLMFTLVKSIFEIVLDVSERCISLCCHIKFYSCTENYVQWTNTDSLIENMTI